MIFTDLNFMLGLILWRFFTKKKRESIFGFYKRVVQNVASLFDFFTKITKLALFEKIEKINSKSNPNLNN